MGGANGQGLRDPAGCGQLGERVAIGYDESLRHESMTSASDTACFAVPLITGIPNRDTCCMNSATGRSAMAAACAERLGQPP